MKKLDRLHWALMVLLLGVVFKASYTVDDAKEAAESVDEHSIGEPDEPGKGERGVLSLYGNGGEVRLDFLETEPDEATEPWLVFREIPDPLMTYDIEEKRWTFSDYFLEDVADALVPVLKERGFVHDAEEE